MKKSVKFNNCEQQILSLIENKTTAEKIEILENSIKDTEDKYNIKIYQDIIYKLKSE